MTTNEAAPVREVYVVVQTKTHPPRDLIVAVCASRERAEHYVGTESHDGDMRIEQQLVLY